MSRSIVFGRLFLAKAYVCLVYSMHQPVVSQIPKRNVVPCCDSIPGVLEKHKPFERLHLSQR